MEDWKARCEIWVRVSANDHSAVLWSELPWELAFDSLGDFLSGTPDVTDGGQSLGDSTRHTYENNERFVCARYLADEFETHFRFGLRWDYYGVVGEKNGLFTNVTSFDPVAQTVTLTQLGQPGLGSVYQPDYKNFAPRLSVAWDLFGKGRTVIRAGWGIFFDGVSQDVFLGELPYNCAFCPGVGYNPAGPAPIFTVGALWVHRPGLPRFRRTPAARRAVTFSQLTGTFQLRIWRTTTSTCNSRFRTRLCCRSGMLARKGTGSCHYLDVNQPIKRRSLHSISRTLTQPTRALGTCFNRRHPDCINSVE